MTWKTLFKKETALPASAPQAAETEKGFEPIAVSADCAYFHVTHWKAASQWMRRIVTDLFGPAVVQPEYFQRQVWATRPVPGRVYACTYVGKAEFTGLKLPSERHFVLIRDLRDTLVSGYFSVRHSHETTSGELDTRRRILTNLNLEDGLLYLAETWLCKSAWIQRSWLSDSAGWYRVEDCFRDPFVMVDRILKECWDVHAPPELLRAVLEKHSFERLSGGRQPGQENVQSHYRRGAAGDWRRHFTPRVARFVHDRYNDLLIRAGHETDSAWVDQVLPSAAPEKAS